MPELTSAAVKAGDGQIKNLRDYVNEVLTTMPDKITKLDTSDESVGAAKKALDDLMSLRGKDLRDAFEAAMTKAKTDRAEKESRRTAHRDALNEMREQLKTWNPMSNAHEIIRQSILTTLLSDITLLDTPEKELPIYATPEDWKMEELNERLTNYRNIIHARKVKDDIAAACRSFMEEMPPEIGH